MRSLPAPGKYFRPTRARCLRRRAEFLDACHLFLLSLAALLLLAGVALVGLDLIGFLTGGPVGWTLLEVPVALVCPFLFELIERLERRVTSCLAEAQDLEREHIARHGAGEGWELVP
jgi:hypothetical protein